ncbi:MAG: hypothetical protein JWO69_1492 [Thermoleophilia bacterium]|jgi:hypothetical protein|nr:hypothetical protein [Thermoleophilia bacterium]
MAATYAQPAPAKQGGTDVAAWALVAVIVALVCAVAGWAIARQDAPGRDDLQRNSWLAAQNGQAQGEQEGYRVGARAGRTEAALRAKQQSATARRTASTEGYQAGYQEGRSRAVARANGDPYFSSGNGSASTLPGYEEILARLGTDAPGYSDSAYASSGFGSSGTAPFAGSTGFGASTYSDQGW